MSNNTTTGNVIRLPGGGFDDRPGLEAARGRRVELHEAMAGLEAETARSSRSSNWLGQVMTALDELGQSLDAHIREVEDGLLVTVVSEAPRLAGQAEKLKADHTELKSCLQRAVSACAGPGDPDPARIRRRITSLLGRLTIHRQLGSDLVYDAYNVDIGEGD